MNRDIFSGLSLLARFTLVSLFVTLLVAGGLAWRLELALERDALAAVAENTADQATNILNKNLTSADLQAALSGERYEQIDTLIHDTLLSANIVRIKIWNRQGLLVYSDDRDILGRVFPIEEDLEEALHGERVAEISDLEGEENSEERGRYSELFKTCLHIQNFRFGRAQISMCGQTQ